jgi:hypothetical protein
MTDFNDVLDLDRKRASAVSQGDRDRTLEAMHALEEAAGSAANGRYGHRSSAWKLRSPTSERATRIRSA